MSELISLVCQKLIDYGVQTHTAWTDCRYNYLPILNFFRNHNCTQYNVELLGQYRQAFLLHYAKEELAHKNYLSKMLTVSRLREFYGKGEISHIIANGNARSKLNTPNEELLQGFLNWNEPVNPKPRLDTTLIYAHANTEIKRKAIEKATGNYFPETKSMESPYDVNDDAILKRLYCLK